MKKILWVFVFIACSILSYSQTATLRLQVPDVQPKPGEQFLVGVWLDELNYQVPTIKSGQFFIVYDSTVLSPVTQGTASDRLCFNPHPEFKVANSVLSSNSPSPGDLRFLFFSLNPPGLNFGKEGKLPVKLWDIKFTYLGGSSSIKWNLSKQLTPVKENEAGGKLEKGTTIITAWDNSVYEITLKDAFIGIR